MGEHGTLSCMYGGTWLGNDFFFFLSYIQIETMM